MKQPGRDNSAPIIVVKKRGGHAGQHGGAWKVAYADFVTAMMAFFLVMWIINQGAKVRSAVAGYFKDPVGFSEKARSGLLDGGKGLLPGEEPPAKDEKRKPERSVQDEEVRAKLQEKAKEILGGLSQLPGFGDMAKQIEVELNEEGLRIQMMEASDSTFFDLGSAKLSSQGAEALAMIGKTIAPLTYDVVLEGHTDSRPYASKDGYTNWELSSDRANSARRLLEANGVPDAKITAIRGYADRRLRFTDRPEDPRNRRIAILVLNPYSRSAERGTASAESLEPTAPIPRSGG